MEFDQNEICPKWNLPKMEFAQNGIGPKWNWSKMDFAQNGLYPKWTLPKIEFAQNEIFFWGKIWSFGTVCSSSRRSKPAAGPFVKAQKIAVKKFL